MSRVTNVICSPSQGYMPRFLRTARWLCPPPSKTSLCTREKRLATFLRFYILCPLILRIACAESTCLSRNRKMHMFSIHNAEERMPESTQQASQSCLASWLWTVNYAIVSSKRPASCPCHINEAAIQHIECLHTVCLQAPHRPGL
jgi:hypothetical protein